MAHPYAGHKETHVGHRRAKNIMKGYKGGGSTGRADGGSALGHVVNREEDEACPSGEYQDGGRLDKKARGGAVGAFAAGGPIRKITPSKRKPHVSVNVINVTGSRGRRPPASPASGLAAGSGSSPIPSLGGALPDALPKPPGMKSGGRLPKRPMGGAIPYPRKGRGLGPLAIDPSALVAPPSPRGPGYMTGGRLAKMRKGNDAGTGSGEGRLDAFKHQKRK